MLYGAVPPEELMLTLPFRLPKHVASFFELMVAETCVGWVMVAETVVVQPLESVTVKV
jgi:hypothetical protein